MKKYIFFILFILLGSSLAYADLIPSTAPCWVKGTVTGSGITVDGLAVSAYKGSTLLKSAIISGGIYSLNSVGANDGDTITLKVDGATFSTFTFVGYCSTGSNPWIVKDFTVSLQADGTTCTSDNICSSGYCSTTCTTPDTTTTVYSSGGGGGGGGGGGSGSGAATTGSSGKGWDTIAQGSDSTFTTSQTEFTKIEFIAADKLSNVELTVNSLQNTPYTNTPLGNTAYKYLEIVKNNIQESDIQSAQITFTVDKSWLAQNSISQENIALYRYVGGAWTMLPTIIVSSEGNVVTFQATTPGFSYFAIASKESTKIDLLGILDEVRNFYAGTSSYTLLDLLDKVRSSYQ